MHMTRSFFSVNFLGTYILLSSLYNPSTHRLRLLCYRILITVYLREHAGIQLVPAKTVDSNFFSVTVTPVGRQSTEGQKAQGLVQVERWKDGCTVWYIVHPRERDVES